MMLCHIAELTNQNLEKTMAAMNDVQLSKDFDGIYLANGILTEVLKVTILP